jgi:hypothetical protein
MWDPVTTVWSILGLWMEEIHYQIKISNRVAALENLDDDVDINRASEGIIT